jgi:hypothetical protein
MASTSKALSAVTSDPNAIGLVSVSTVEDVAASVP